MLIVGIPLLPHQYSDMTRRYSEPSAICRPTNSWRPSEYWPVQSDRKAGRRRPSLLHIPEDPPLSPPFFRSRFPRLYSTIKTDPSVPYSTASVFPESPSSRDWIGIPNSVFFPGRSSREPGCALLWRSSPSIVSRFSVHICSMWRSVHCRLQKRKCWSA